MSITYHDSSSAGNSSGGNLTVTKPTNTVNGNLLVAVLYREGGSWTLPAGWTQSGSDQASANGGNLNLSIAWKIASGEPTDWTFNLSATTWRTIVISAFTVTGTAQIDAVAVGANSPSSTAQDTVASITTTAINTTVISAHGNFNGSAVNPAGGYTEAVDLGGTAIHYKDYTSSGATGSYNSGFSPTLSNGGDWATLHVAFSEAASGANGVVNETLGTLTASSSGMVNSYPRVGIGSRINTSWGYTAFMIPYDKSSVASSAFKLYYFGELTSYPLGYDEYFFINTNAVYRM